MARLCKMSLPHRPMQRSAAPFRHSARLANGASVVPDAENGLPDRAARDAERTQPGLSQQLVNSRNRVNEGSKRVSVASPAVVLPASVQVDVPAIPGKGRRPIAPAERRGGQQQRIELVIAAEHPIKRYQIRRRDRGSQSQKIPVQKCHSVALSPSLGLILRGLHKCATGLHVHCGADSSG